MKHILSVPKSTIDLNQVRYDLAKIYAQEKFRYALNHGCIPNDTPEIDHPEFLDETEYLLREFETALSTYWNTDDLTLLKQLDFTYEPDSE